MIDPDDTLSGYFRERVDDLPYPVQVVFRVMMFLGGMAALFVPIIMELVGALHGGEAHGIWKFAQHGVFFLVGVVCTMIGLFGPTRTVDFFASMPWEKLLRRK